MSARRRWARIHEVPGMPAAAFIAGLLFIFQPAQVYQGNAAYFYQFQLAQLFSVLLPGFLAAFLLLAAFAALGGARWRKASAAALSAVALALWGGATFFTASEGLLDGRASLQLADRAHVGWNLVATVVLLAAGAAGALLAPRLTRRFFSLLFALLLAQALWITATDPKGWRQPADFQRLVTLSAERNLLVILLDAFQSDFLAEILQRDARLARAFQGFTYFPHAVGPSPTTYLALPVIHGAARIHEGERLQKLYDTAVVKESFVAKLAASGYDAMVVNAVLGKCPQGARCENSDQLVHGMRAVALDSAALLLNLSLFRTLPHVFKPAVYRDGRWWLPWGLELAKVQTANALLDLMARDLSAGNARPTVRFLHLFNTHAPASVDGECRPVQGLAWLRETAIAQDRCALVNVAALLDSLRTRHLYDRTAIVVLADHGSGMPREGPHGFTVGAQASPLLMVKPLGAAGALRISERFVGLADVPATACALMSAACDTREGIDVLDGRHDAGRRSYGFVTYVWRNQFGVDALPFDDRFEVRGPPQRVGSWWRVTNLPAVPAGELQFAPSDPKGTYGFGWSDFETYEGRSLRWAVGPEADLYVQLDPAAGARFSFEAWTHPANDGQEVEVEVNGSPVGRVAIGHAPATHEVTVPAAVLRDGADRILFRFLKWNPPGKADSRRLAVLFDKMRIQQEKK